MFAACGDDPEPQQIMQPASMGDGAIAPGVVMPVPTAGNGMGMPPGIIGGAWDGGVTPIGPAPSDAGAVDAAAPIVTADASVPSEGGAPPVSNAPRCMGKPGARRGKSSQTLSVGGAQRTFIYYAPQGLDPNTPVPLVLIPHGTNMSGAGMYDLTEYWKLADREKFVAIFPDGIDGPGSLWPWNVGDGVCGLGAFVATGNDDVGFMNALIKYAQDDQCIDEQHIFMTGFSMGGYFSHETGCMNPKVRAVAPHSGGTHDLSVCANKHKPVFIMHHTTDSLIWYDCATDARDRWVKQNGCTAANPDVVQVKGGKCEYYKGCPADGQVALCTFGGNDLALPPGHCWSGGVAQGENSFAACTDDEENAAELGWAFFKKYAW